MGLLVDGKWADQWYDTKATGGHFVRAESTFRSWIRADGSTAFQPATGRYHLYVSLACPWAHRTLIFRAIKGLEHAIDVSIVHWHMADKGWTFEPGADVIADAIHNASHLHQIYTAADPHFTGRVTVPVLWDKHTNTVVNNESSEIIRMFNHEFNDVATAPDLDLYPHHLREAIDTINAVVYDNVNNGVYRCGFATSQAAYEQAEERLFATLNTLDERLSRQRYLCGDQITEADWRLFTTLVRFDPVYHTHFKCYRRALREFEHLWPYTRDLYQTPGVAQTVNMMHIRRHYFGSHETINPSRIVPVGPNLDFMAPHERG